MNTTKQQLVIDNNKRLIGRYHNIMDVFSCIFETLFYDVKTIWIILVNIQDVFVEILLASPVISL